VSIHETNTDKKIKDTSASRLRLAQEVSLQKAWLVAFSASSNALRSSKLQYVLSMRANNKIHQDTKTWAITLWYLFCFIVQLVIVQRGLLAAVVRLLIVLCPLPTLLQ
jgi:hypothetical protein